MSVHSISKITLTNAIAMLKIPMKAAANNNGFVNSRGLPSTYF